MKKEVNMERERWMDFMLGCAWICLAVATVELCTKIPSGSIAALMGLGVVTAALGLGTLLGLVIKKGHCNFEFEQVKGLGIGLGVASLLISTVFGTVLAAMTIIVWFQKTGNIFIQHPGLDFSSYADTLHLWYCVAASGIGITGLYLLYGRKRIARLAA